MAFSREFQLYSGERSASLQYDPTLLLLCLDVGRAARQRVDSSHPEQDKDPLSSVQHAGSQPSGSCSDAAGILVALAARKQEKNVDRPKLMVLPIIVVLVVMVVLGLLGASEADVLLLCLGQLSMSNGQYHCSWTLSTTPRGAR
jgi:hypothetical protein